MKMNMRAWIQSVLTSEQRMALPIMTHPGIEITGKTVKDLVTDGQTHFESIKALDDMFPALAVTMAMDLTVEAEAFGAQIVFYQNEIPSVTGRLVSDMDSVSKLAVPSLQEGRIPQYLLASKLAAQNINKPVFSGCIGPYSLAGRLFDLSEIMTACFLEPETIMALLDKCTSFLIDYCNGLKQQGVSGVIMAEPAAGLLSGDLCDEFSSKYVKQIVDAVQDDNFMLILHNCGNTGECTKSMISTGAWGYHFGNAMDMKTALEECPSDVLVMGNIDPTGCFKMGTPELMYETVTRLLNETSPYHNFVLSSGCDTPPGSSLDNIRAFYKALDNYNQK